MTNNQSMKETLICKGMPVSSGVIYGKARILSERHLPEDIDKGDILVLPRSHPVYSAYVMTAGGVICEIGGRLAHICIISLEMGVPCITQVNQATKILAEGQTIKLDADNGCVYGMG
jgi:phosphohistidine swiveling domain-containing protein